MAVVIERENEMFDKIPFKQVLRIVKAYMLFLDLLA